MEVNGVVDTGDEGMYTVISDDVLSSLINVKWPVWL